MGNRVDINSKLGDIFEETNWMITPEQIIHITDDEVLIKKFLEVCRKTKRDPKKMREFVIQNQYH